MPDPLLRPACEAALQVAKAGQVAGAALHVPLLLRPLLRFAKLNGAALATVRRVLDDDDAFRRHVCLELDLPGGRDDLGAASVLFLERPPGWEEELARLASEAAEAAGPAGADRADAVALRRLEAVQAAHARAEAEVRSLRADVGSWRDKAAAERRGRRTAESDVGRLRKRIAELEGERAHGSAPGGPGAPDVRDATDLGSSATAVARADARAAHADDRAARAEAAARKAGAEASEARAAVAAEAASPPSPLLAVDHVAVAGAVTDAVTAVAALAEALGRAAAALRATWSDSASGPPPAAPGEAQERRGRPRPAGAMEARVPRALPPAVFDDEVAAAEHLLRIPRVLALVDGYNVTLTARREDALPAQRRWLLDTAAGFAARTGAEFIVVFDGDAEGGGHDHGHRRHGVQVRFTTADVEADDVVLHLLAVLPPERPVVVVSDDHRVRDGARRMGANVLGVDQLVGALRR